MQESLGRTVNEQLDGFIYGDGREAPALPTPAGAPGEFLVRMGEGFSGPLNELAGAMEAFGPGAADCVPLGRTSAAGDSGTPPSPGLMTSCPAGCAWTDTHAHLIGQ